jgi:hypothetical protein
MITVDQQNLVFEPLDESAWRLCDTNIDEHDAARLVAYVERVDSGYEAIWLGLGMRPSWYASRAPHRSRPPATGRDHDAV